MKRMNRRDFLRLSAMAAGMGAIAAAWGYLGDGLPLDAWGADAIIQSPGELTGLLR